ncbi:ArsC/Spx/MgsR family protein [Lactococcus garvieae]|jgi:regulatory protein spx|uniref:Transcriptional regulator Spx n=2 Tax=Lactococcus garvieae TaxID=1363 RepID=K2NSM6_9LACT|nr:ArsC/Spx/MgsR family protein [Lactococcus garvieae]EKF50553.1 transcriptional regulator Spx [Lactococcus garvieae DCC43]QPS71825.1 transcriptional regulator Spx [Lactococcus garvieae]
MWFDKYGIKIEKRNLNQITIDELINLLALTTDGTKELFKNPEKNGWKNEKLLLSLEDMDLKSALLYLKMNTFLFKSPIILDEDNYLVGYNSDEIRRFFPKEYRKFLSDF